MISLLWSPKNFSIAWVDTFANEEALLTGNFFNVSYNVSFQNPEAQVEEVENKASPKAERLTPQTSEDNEVFGMLFEPLDIL